MRFDIFSLFPEVFGSYIDTSILKRAIRSGIMEVYLHDIRAWTTDRHHVCDDTPYGGGGGMVMKAEPIFSSIEDILGVPSACPVILMSPQGRQFSTTVAQELAALPRIALLCGHYEGVDERVIEHLVTDQISVGDYVLTGGELPALTIMDAVARFLPGTLGDPGGAYDDSFATGLLEYPHYTKPAVFRGWEVPGELMSGNHALIDKWRQDQALARTQKNRPDLLK